MSYSFLGVEATKQEQLIESLIKTFQEKTPEIAELRKWSAIPNHIDTLIDQLIEYKIKVGMSAYTKQSRPWGGK